jgi:ADP-ribose pyrophosphatase YjhB (NUDIX family)
MFDSHQRLSLSSDHFRRGFVYGVGVCVVVWLLWAWLFAASTAPADSVVVTADDFPRLSVDVILECADESGRIALQQRSAAPVGVALPTAYVELGEPVEHTAVRVVHEVAGVSVALHDCHQFHVYSAKHRDKRTAHNVAVAVVCAAQDCLPLRSRDHMQLFDKDSVPWRFLVFDHGVIVRDYFDKRWPIWRWLNKQPYERE